MKNILKYSWRFFVCVVLFPIRGTYFLQKISNLFVRFSIEVEGRIRQLHARRTRHVSPEILSHDGNDGIQKCVCEFFPPWKGIDLVQCPIPNMLTQEEKKYYSYIGRFYRGEGKVVELGPWLGGSTFYILQGLKTNKKFNGQKLYAFDDFIWRGPWMDAYMPPGSPVPSNGQSFRHLFDQYAHDLKSNIEVSPCKIVAREGNHHLPDLIWNNGPIEMCCVDVGRDLEINKAWYQALRGNFIPNKTLLIMQDWRTFREIPAKWYNQTKEFTESEKNSMELIHELRNGGIATFIYRG